MNRKKSLPRNIKNAVSEDSSTKTKQPSLGSTTVCPFDNRSVSTIDLSDFEVNDCINLDELISENNWNPGKY